jgi:NMD protein affecting ribosome stability and mRNA decay
VKSTVRNQSRRTQPWHAARTSGENHPPAVAHEFPTPADPTICTSCQAIYSRKVWRWPKASAKRVVVGAARGLCPACRQVKKGVFYGLVQVVGRFASEEEDLLRSRITNVAERASFTQPERRIVSIRKRKPGLEISTTSQKLAHRIARELHKAFGGEVKYSWSDNDGALRAVWSGGKPIGPRSEPPLRKKSVKRRRVLTKR